MERKYIKISEEIIALSRIIEAEMGVRDMARVFLVVLLISFSAGNVQIIFKLYKLFQTAPWKVSQAPAAWVWTIATAGLLQSQWQGTGKAQIPRGRLATQQHFQRLTFHVEGFYTDADILKISPLAEHLK